jgi:uncharacterized protein (DUF2249 family)
MAAVFTVENDIPAPKSERQELIATLRKLTVGQSVLVTDKPIRYASHCAQEAKGGTEKYFECRAVTTGVRVWRLE